MAWQLVPVLGVLVHAQEHDPGGGSLVGVVRLLAAIVDRKLGEVREDRNGKLGTPSVAAQLEGRFRVLLDLHGGLLRFQKELAGFADAEGVIGGLHLPVDLQGILVDHFAVGRGVPGFVRYVPTELFHQRIEELLPHLRFVVRGALIGRSVEPVALDQFENGGGDRHARALPICGG